MHQFFGVSFPLWQDERYSKYIGKQAIVPLTFGRHVPIISDKVELIFFSIPVESSSLVI